MPHLFISHSTKDDNFTRKLTDQLTTEGFDVWVDFDDIKSGDRWVASIQKAIEDCEAVVVVMSHAARASEWVEREALLAMDLKKPIQIALIENLPLPLHLINRQFTDFRSDQDKAVKKLVKVLQKFDDDGTKPRHIPKPLSPLPNTTNFFKYLAKRPGGKQNSAIARNLYRWAKANTDRVEFGGKITPGFHARVQVGESELTLFSVWAYPSRPSVQVQFRYLMDYPPYHDATLRQSTLKSLGKLTSSAVLEDKADRRPTFPLDEVLNTDEKQALFKQIIQEIIDNLRSE